MNLSEHDFSLFLKALAFAARKHSGQRRKDQQTPYINHPIQVAESLWREGSVRDIETLLAAVLHDTVEDTGTKPEEIQEQFGDAVRDLVMEVTDDKSLPKQERKRLQIERAPHISDRAKLIKLADKIDNVRALTYAPPTDWSLERKREYLDWGEKVVRGLRGQNPQLESIYDRVLAEARAVIQ